MRKLLLIATLSVAALAMSQTERGNVADTTTANNDWYNQRLSALVQVYERVEAASVPSMMSSAPSAIQTSTQPASMASNSGEQRTGEDWYNRTLAKVVDQYQRDLAEAASSAALSR